jgi:hypothetical protein
LFRERALILRYTYIGCLVAVQELICDSEISLCWWRFVLVFLLLLLLLLVVVVVVGWGECALRWKATLLTSNLVDFLRHKVVCWLHCLENTSDSVTEFPEVLSEKAPSSVS